MPFLRRAVAPVAALLTAMVVMAMLAAPAWADDGDNKHPSGKDRSMEAGASGVQGRSTSDPDGDSNGGPDKPGGSGGVDRDDQDGNNGCGNDDDFEDDNNGNCLGRKKAKARVVARAVAPPATTGTPEPEPQAAESTATGTQAEAQSQPAPAGPTAALGADLSSPALLVADRIDVADAAVLGMTVERAEPAVATEQVRTQASGDATPASLARTGITILTWVGLGLFLLALGILIRRAAAR